MKIHWITAVRMLVISIFMLAATGASGGAESRYELSGRLNIIGGSGKPTNDVLGYGLLLHRRLNQDWYLGINLEHSPEFDFERPSKIVGIRSDIEIDAVGTMTILTVVAERRYALESTGWIAFWNLGAGFGEIDLDNATGDIRGGGSYDIETDVDTEVILTGSAGWMQQLGEHWSARYALSAEHHSGDWELRDRTSGKTGKIDDYALYGLRLGMNYRF